MFQISGKMAPSGSNIPQRLRQRQPDVLEAISGGNASSQKNWDNLLDRRKQCKQRYEQMKKDISEATEYLQKLDNKSFSHKSVSTIDNAATAISKYNAVFRIGPNSFLNKKNEKPITTRTNGTLEPKTLHNPHMPSIEKGKIMISYSFWKNQIITYRPGQRNWEYTIF